ncbi:MAG: OPT/YSL family transporter [Deltaproteobacteria bacterium]|nr:OPT/YSL family transporter [Deltaproteobacteria bacterium]
MPEPLPDRLYEPAPGERQLSVRAVLAGIVVGGVLSAMDVYLGLRLGITAVGSSLVGAVLAYALFAALRPKSPLSVLETNIAQTTASGAGTMAAAAGLVAPIPALAMLGHKLPLHGLLLWALSIAYLGSLVAVPLRRRYIVVERLRFPTGTAAAGTILAMAGRKGETLAQARALLRFGGGAAVFVLAAYFVRPLEEPPIAALGLAVLAKWAFFPTLSPVMVGVGLLIGPRVGASLLAGAVVAWGALGPVASRLGWAPGPVMSMTSGPRGWLLWVGVAIMLAEGMTTLALSWRSLAAGLAGVLGWGRGGGPGASEPLGGDEVPRWWWLGGLGLATAAAILLGWLFFGVHPLLGLVAVALSLVLAQVAVRCAGETDLNPMRMMVSVTQLVFGAIAPGAVRTNLTAAAVTSAGAAQAGDMMQDFRTGHLLGASPRKQFIAQLWGIGAGVLFCVPAYYLFARAFTIGEGELPAPAAHAWRAVAELLARGPGALPGSALWPVLAGALFGAALPLLQACSPRLRPYLPSGLAFGLAFLVPAQLSLTIFLGALVLVGWRACRPAQWERLGQVVACGLIAGESVAGVLRAALQLCGVRPLVGGG